VALAWTLSALSPACRSRTEPAPAASASVTDSASTAPFGGLDVKSGGDLREDERGGTAVVLLHGYGASGDDLVSLAQSLPHPRTRYVVPAAPLALPGGGRAWWPLARPLAYDAEQELVVPSALLTSSRRAVQGVLRTIRERYAPDTLCLLGFSQGAMLALDVAVGPASGVARVAVLSGALPQETSRQLTKDRAPRPLVFVSHGRVDRVLRFSGAEHMVERLQSSGYSVSFSPFNGGHEISSGTVALLQEFLFAA
jgi:phospholipase/carboxylesterase